MPKNKKRRPKFKKVRNVRDVQLKLGDQEYAKIISPLGNCRFELLCEDNKNRIGVLKGSMRNRVYVRAGDYVLVSLRNGYNRLSLIQKDKKEECDIILKYFREEINLLIENNHIKNLEFTAIEGEDEFDLLSSDDENDENNEENDEKDSMDINIDDIDI